MPSTIGVVAASTAFSPLSLFPALWLDASDTGTIASVLGKVDTWSDKSGNGRHFTQATDASRPSTGIATQNGRNVLSFDGGNNLAHPTESTWTFMHNGTPIIVAFVASNTTNARMYLGNTDSSAGRGVSFYRTGTGAFRHGVTNGSQSVITNESDAAFVGSGVELYTIVYDPDLALLTDRSSIYKNNGSAIKNNVATAGASVSPASWPFRVGAVSQSPTSPSLPLIGSIAEIVIIAGSNATEQNRVAIRDYLNQKWAVY